MYLPEIDLWLDSLRKKDTSLISHAHSDHTARHLRPVLTPNTLLLLSDYLKKSDPIPLSYHEPLDCGKYTLTLYPAGHCLGSAQALIQSKSGVVGVGVRDQTGVPLSKGVQPQVYLREIHAAFKNYLQSAQGLGAVYPTTGPVDLVGQDM